MMFLPHRKHTPSQHVTRITFIYVADVRTSQETYAITACYEDNATFIYVDDVRTSQEAYAFTSCYRDSFLKHTFVCYR
jgi:hypothetical protein